MNAAFLGPSKQQLFTYDSGEIECFNSHQIASNNSNGFE